MLRIDICVLTDLIFIVDQSTVVNTWVLDHNLYRKYISKLRNDLNSVKYLPEPQNKGSILPVATLSIALYVPSKSRSSRDVTSEVCNFVISITNFNK